MNRSLDVRVLGKAGALCLLVLGLSCSSGEPSAGGEGPQGPYTLSVRSDTLKGWDCNGYPGSYFITASRHAMGAKGLLGSGQYPGLAWSAPSVGYYYMAGAPSQYRREYVVSPVYACGNYTDCKDTVYIKQGESTIHGAIVLSESRNVDWSSGYGWGWYSQPYACNTEPDPCDNPENTAAQLKSGGNINQCACPAAAPYDWASVPGDRCYPCPEGFARVEPGGACVDMCEGVANPQACLDCRAGGGGAACRCNQLPPGPERDLCACIAWDGGQACYKSPNGEGPDEQLPGGEGEEPPPEPPGGQPGPNAGQKDPCDTAAGDPVDLTTGAELLRHACMDLSSTGLPLSAAFAYDSLRASRGVSLAAIGPGWSAAYTRRALHTADTLRPGQSLSIRLYNEKGLSYEYRPLAANANEYVQPGTTRDWGYILRDAATGQMTHHYAQGGMDVYTADGRLRLVRDRAGNELELTRVDVAAGEYLHVLHNKTTGQKLERVHRLLTFGTKQRWKLVAVRDSADNRPAGDTTPLRGVVLEYDTQGRLVKVVDVDGGAVRYGYDSRHRVVRICDKNQDPADTVADDCTQVTYDNDWKVVRETVPGGTVMELDWTNRGDYNLEVRYTHPGRPGERLFQRYKRDAHRNLLRVYNPNSTTEYTERVYDALGRLTQERDPLGRSTHYTYGATTGSLLSVTGPDGLARTMTYNGQGQLTSTTYPTGVREEFSYDALTGLLVQRRKVPVANSGLATQVWNYQYNAAGQMTATQEPDGTWNTQAYDARGYPTVQTLDANHGANTGRLALQSRKTHDWRGYLVQAVDAQGRVTQVVNDAKGRALSVTQPSPTGSGTVTTSLQYDKEGNLTQVVKDAGGPLQQTSLVKYAAVGQRGIYQPVETTDALGQRVSISHHSLTGEVERLVEEALGARTTQLVFTPRGHLRHLVLADGRVTGDTEYNAAGQATAKVDARGVRTEYVHDGAGRVVVLRQGTASVEGLPAENLEYTYTYDLAGRPVTVRDPGGRQMALYEYDGLGRVAAVTDAQGVRVVNTHDAMDRVVAMESSGRRMQRVYDALGRLVSETQDPGTLNLTTQYAYTATGVGEAWTLKSMTDPRGFVTRYTYNTAGMLVTLLDGRSGTWQFAHDTLKRQTRVTDALGLTTDYTHDALGRVLSEGRGGRTLRWTWRADGQMATSVDMTGRTTRYTYDVTGRPTSIDYPGGTTTTPTAADVELKYTANNLLSYAGLVGGKGRVYVHDALNRPLFTESDASMLHYGYGAHGERESLYYGHNFAVTQVLGSGTSARTGKVNLLGQGLSASLSLGYNASGELTEVTRTGGLRTGMTRDSVGRLVSLSHTLGTATVLGQSYAYDRSSNRTRVTEGGVAQVVSYDALSRMTQTQRGGVTTTYGYDVLGNLTHVGGAQVYTYDATSAERLEGTSYAYDANGNLQTDGTTDFTYDTANRLVKSVRKDGTLVVDYLYDARGNLREQLVNGVSVRLEVDESARFPRVVSALVGAGWRQHYVYGPWGAVVARASGPAWDALIPEYALTDAQGTVRRWAAANGTVTASKDYDAWGNVTQVSAQPGQSWKEVLCQGTAACLSSMPDSVNRMGLGYTGEWHSPDGILFLRARVYHPGLRRFLQRDSFRGYPQRPMSLNRYSYVEGNPFTYADPSGRCKQPSPGLPPWDPCRPNWSNLPDPGWTFNPIESLRQQWGGLRMTADVVFNDFVTDAEMYGWHRLKAPPPGVPEDLYTDPFDHISFSAEYTIRGNDVWGGAMGDFYEWMNAPFRTEDFSHSIQDLNNNHVGRLLGRRMLAEGITRDTPDLRYEIFKRVAEMLNCNSNPYETQMPNGIMLWPQVMPEGKRYQDENPLSRGITEWFRVWEDNQ